MLTRLEFDFLEVKYALVSLSGEFMSTESQTGTAGAATLDGKELSASLTVKDIEKSLAWYENVLGLTVAQKHEREGQLRAASLRAGDVRLLINQDDGARGWDRAVGEGFSLQITVAKDIDAIANGIKERGGTLDSEPADMPWGARYFRFRDPDGYKLTVSQPL